MDRVGWFLGSTLRGLGCRSLGAASTAGPYIRPLKAGEAKSMARALNWAYPDTSWDLVNIVASFMPPIAKPWTRRSQGRHIRGPRVRAKGTCRVPGTQAGTEHRKPLRGQRNSGDPLMPRGHGGYKGGKRGHGTHSITSIYPLAFVHSLCLY